MAVLSRLLRTDSMAGAVGVYVPAMVLQKVLGLVRMLLLMYFLVESELGLWGIGSMVFTLGAQVLALGGNQALVRYVSHCETRGSIRQFYRLVRSRVTGIILVIGLAAFISAPLLTRQIIVSRAETVAFTFSHQLQACRLAVANAAAMAVYLCVVAFASGMRLYRLVSALEVFYGVLFTAVAAVSLQLSPTGLTVLNAHALSLGVSIVVGVLLLQLALRRADGSTAAAEPRPFGAEPPPSSLPATDLFGRFLWFGLIALIGGLLWQGAGYISFQLINREYGKAVSGVFYVFLLLSQLVAYLANSAWAVIFTHVATRWENRQRQAAAFVLTTAYKAVAVAIMTLGILVVVSAPIWVRAIPDRYAGGRVYLPGMMMFFLALNHLALINILARLHERPLVIALVALAGGVANFLLARLWMPTWGPNGAAWAAGVGMYAGGGAVAASYLLAKRVKLSAGTWIVQALPGLMLPAIWAPAWVVGIAWCVFLAVAAFTPWIFDRSQKEALRYNLRKFTRFVRRAWPRG